MKIENLVFKLNQKHANSKYVLVYMCKPKNYGLYVIDAITCEIVASVESQSSRNLTNIAYMYEKQYLMNGN